MFYNNPSSPSPSPRSLLPPPPSQSARSKSNCSSISPLSRPSNSPPICLAASMWITSRLEPGRLGGSFIHLAAHQPLSKWLLSGGNPRERRPAGSLSVSGGCESRRFLPNLGPNGCGAGQWREKPLEGMRKIKARATRPLSWPLLGRFEVGLGAGEPAPSQPQSKWPPAP